MHCKLQIKIVAQIFCISFIQDILIASARNHQRSETSKSTDKAGRKRLRAPTNDIAQSNENRGKRQTAAIPERVGTPPITKEAGAPTETIKRLRGATREERPASWNWNEQHETHPQTIDCRNQMETAPDERERTTNQHKQKQCGFETHMSIGRKDGDANTAIVNSKRTISHAFLTAKISTKERNSRAGHSWRHLHELTDCRPKSRTPIAEQRAEDRRRLRRRAWR
ncbi:hypothetical protein R1flu_012617 [Riccia fluitans]|uniref:Secreted protein n=1 Tax=Riccia fluitans TaxID=41844 RepID=A0ABD1ZB33_9MARC